MHCVDDTYDWFGARESFIPAVNDSSADGRTVTGLGGQRDWRLPNIAELQTILNCSSDFATCVDPIFGPTAPHPGWSSSSGATNPTLAWGVFFFDFSGSAHLFSKSSSFRVRAVRGGR